MANLKSVLNIGKNLSKARKKIKSSSLFGKGRSALEKVKGCLLYTSPSPRDS